MKTLTECVELLRTADGLATALFKEHRRALDETVKRAIKEQRASGVFSALVRQAEAGLAAWQAETGKPQKYTPEELATARIRRICANSYEQEHDSELMMANALHSAAIQYVIKHETAPTLVREGNAGRLFGIVEISSRLAPALTFPGSSAYFVFAGVPYSTNARAALGELRTSGSVITLETARQSAYALQKKFGVYYTLAETSAAPRTDIPKSGRLPEVYIVGRAGDEEKSAVRATIDTPLRTEFDAAVRELLFRSFEGLYGLHHKTTQSLNGGGAP